MQVVLRWNRCSRIVARSEDQVTTTPDSCTILTLSSFHASSHASRRSRTGAAYSSAASGRHLRSIFEPFNRQPGPLALLFQPFRVKTELLGPNNKVMNWVQSAVTLEIWFCARSVCRQPGPRAPTSGQSNMASSPFRRKTDLGFSRIIHIHEVARSGRECRLTLPCLAFALPKFPPWPFENMDYRMAHARAASDHVCDYLITMTHHPSSHQIRRTFR